MSSGVPDVTDRVRAWAAGLTLAGGVLVLTGVVLLPIIYTWPGAFLGINAEAIQDRLFAHGVAPVGIVFLLGLIPAALVLWSGWNMTSSDAPRTPAYGAVALLGAVLAIPVLGGMWFGTQFAALGGALHLAASRTGPTGTSSQ